MKLQKEFTTSERRACRVIDQPRSCQRYVAKPREDEVALVPVFVAFVGEGAGVRLSAEHDRAEWLPPAEAGRRFAWPRERRALEDAVALLGTGDAGAVEDVLRIC